MQITHITHASILINANNRVILSDPWWKGPCFGAQWWNYPSPHLSALEHVNIDFIYISHGHHDHFHRGTLNTLSKDATVLVSSHIDLADAIRELGFKVIELDDDKPIDIGAGVVVGITQTYAGDTYMAISDGQEVCVNLNDSLHSAPTNVQKRFCEKISSLYPTVDYLFCGYGVASHFPNCYRIPGKDYEETASHRQRYFNQRWSAIVKQIEPRFGFPFAADVVFLDDDLFWCNAPTHNSERPTAAFSRLYPEAMTAVIDIAPGFSIDNGRVTRDIRRADLDPGALAEDYKSEIERANRHAEVSPEAFDTVLKLVRLNVEVCREYLEEFQYDYCFLIRFHSSRAGIEIRKSGRSVTIDRADVPEPGVLHEQYDVVFTTRLPYLRWSLTRPYGHETLFVGSGGIFSIKSRAGVKRQLHVELRQILRKVESPPTRAAKPANRVLLTSKKLIKRAFGIAEQDLYDLDRWTTYCDHGEPASRQSHVADQLV